VAEIWSHKELTHGMVVGCAKRNITT